MPFSFTPVTVPELRRTFLEDHEHVLCSSIVTINDDAAATAHLERIASPLPRLVRPA